MNKKISRHRGEVLKEAVDRSRRKKEAVAKSAGYTRASYYIHIKDRDLPDHIMEAYGKALGVDFLEQFPEMRPYMEEPVVEYRNAMTTEDLIADRDKWKNKYIVLLERFNKLLEEKKKIR